MGVSMFKPFKGLRRSGIARILQSVLLAGGLIAAPGLFAAESGDRQHGGHATPVAMPG